MNRTIYDAAFAILETQNAICGKLESIGLRFEYGDGFVGESLESLINNAQMIVMESLGLYENTQDINVRICGEFWPTKLEILYTCENDKNWAITVDDFFEFFYKAINDSNIRDLMWKAMVEKDVQAKEQYNNLNHGRIGIER